MADHTRNIKENKDSANINLIANKEAAYALTGVAVGAVYKTEDTGQVMEYLGDVLPLYGGFTIAGSAAIDGELSQTMNGDYTFQGIIDGRPRWTSPEGQQFTLFASGSTWAGFGLGAWYTSGTETNPADVTTWTNDVGSGSLLQSEFTKADPASNPYNWKMDGVVQVFDNDDKQLLTNLPDGQQVEIVGEGRRIERFNGDGDGLNAWDFKILVNHPDDPVISGYRINGIYTYEAGYLGYVNDDGVILGDYGDGTYVFYTGSIDWSATINGLATPDLMSPWTAQSTNAQGYAAMTSDMITRQPTATESNWSDIVPTAEIILDDTVGSGNMSWNGSAVQGATAVNYGWYQLDRPYSFTASNVISVTRDGTTTELELTGSGAGNGLYNHIGSYYTAMLDDNKKVRSITITQGA